MDEGTKDGLGVALNEAALLGAEVIQDRRCAAITFAVLSLPLDGAPPPVDSRVSLVLVQVGRVVASLRNARWDDDQAPAVPFALAELLKTVQSFGGQPVYGWKFIDTDDGYERWANRLSLDERFDGGSKQHSITLFQEGYERHLDLRLWFGGLRIFRPDRTEIAIGEFVAAGKRWWDGLYSGDPRTRGSGIYPSNSPIPPVVGPAREGQAGAEIHEG
ncbi:MAG: hypothetical protein HUU18_01870 [Phycisphaerales bacterium]|nr:hypothetical protein [Phycisphaerales bacterium]